MVLQIWYYVAISEEKAQYINVKMSITPKVLFFVLLQCTVVVLVAEVSGRAMVTCESLLV